MSAPEPRRPAMRTELPAAGTKEESLNENQEALVAFSQVLEGMTAGAEPRTSRTFAMMEGGRSQVEVARERVERFLAQQRAIAEGIEAPRS